MNITKTQLKRSAYSTSNLLGWLSVGMLCTASVGCQNMNSPRTNPLVSARPNDHALRSAASNSRGQASPATPGYPVASDVNNQNNPVAQVSYQVPVDGGNVHAEYDSGNARIQMPMVPGQVPMAANLPMSSAHGQGCPCCSSGYGKYQPVYANGDFSGAACSDACSPAPICNGYDPQEYIYDGGDQDPAVRIRTDYSVVGLGPEDTVVQFTTEDGREFAETGCRTAIYAPRFASVRRITNYGKSDGVWATKATLKGEPTIHMHAPLPPVQVADKMGAKGENSVKVVEAFRERNRGVPMLQNQGPRGWVGHFGPYEDLQVIRTGVVDIKEGPQLIKYTANAIAWSTVDELMVYVNNQATELVEAEDHPQELHTYELGGARIRLCKVASQQSANVGEVVDFTIRYDNIAEQTLSKLVIHDSLPPRLEYVADSQQSSMPAEFENTPNDVGSDVLKWTIEGPLKPGEGGIVRFQCRVR